MTNYEFWQMLAESMAGSDCDKVCPVDKYSVENNSYPICQEVGGCAAALRELALKLEREEQ